MTVVAIHSVSGLKQGNRYEVVETIDEKIFRISEGDQEIGCFLTNHFEIEHVQEQQIILQGVV